MSQLNIEKDFLSNVDYLNALVKKVKGVSTKGFDSNLVYEVHYADLYLSNIIPQIIDSDLLKQIDEIKSAFDFILCSVPYDKLDESISKGDYMTLIKTKYKDIDLGSYTKDVAYSTGESSMSFYLKNRVCSILVTLALPILVVSGVLYKLAGFLLNFFDSILLGAESTADTAVATQNVQASSELISSLPNTVTIILNLIVMMVMLCCLMVDLMYIFLPFMRMMLADKSSNLISEEAILAVEMSETNSSVGYKKVKSFDRIKRNKAWLSSMLETLKPIKDKSEFSSLYQKLDNLKTDIDAHDFGSLSDRKHLYFQYAKIEFLHNEFLSLMKDYSSEGV